MLMSCCTEELAGVLCRCFKELVVPWLELVSATLLVDYGDDDGPARSAA